MENSIVTKAYAKVNLSLNICGVKGNMHTLDSIIAPINLCDDITLEFNDSRKTQIEFIGANVPLNNSAIKAAEFLRGYIPDLGVTAKIKKGIPIAGGLGGSSADAAAIIRAALDKFNYLNKADVIKNSVCIGSDVPAMTYGGCVRLRGTGENITPVAIPSLNMVIASGPIGVNTAEAYAAFDRMYTGKRFTPADNDCIASLFKKNDVVGAAMLLCNALQKPVAEMCHEISGTLAAIKSTHPLACFMTGSGSFCCGLYTSRLEAENAARALYMGGLYGRAVKTL